MSDTTKKVLLSVFIVILVAGIAFGIYWAVKNYDKVEQGLSGNNLYTAEDLENAKKEGYEEGISSLKTLESQIEDLKSKLENKINEVNNLNSQIADLNNEIERLENEKVNSNNEINNLNTQINDLNNEIANLNTQIDSLNTQIEEYVILLDAYSEYVNRTYVITFYSKDESVLKSVVVDKNTTFDTSLLPTAPDLEGFVFDGWSSSANSSDIVSFDNLVVNSNMKFYAVYYRNYEVVMKSDGVDISTQLVREGESVALPTEMDSLGSFIFKGWVLAENDNVNYHSNNSTIYSSNEINVNSNMTFVAVYGLESGNYQYLNESEVEAEITVGEFYFSDFSALESLDSKYLLNQVTFNYMNPFSNESQYVHENFKFTFSADSLTQTETYFKGEFVNGIPMNSKNGIAFTKISN